MKACTCICTCTCAVYECVRRLLICVRTPSMHAYAICACEIKAGPICKKELYLFTYIHSAQKKNKEKKQKSSCINNSASVNVYSLTRLCDVTLNTRARAHTHTHMHVQCKKHLETPRTHMQVQLPLVDHNVPKTHQPY